MRGRNKWGFGLYSDVVSIEASSSPETHTDLVVTMNAGANVRISWSLPNTNGAGIEEYVILIKQADGDFTEETTYCAGAQPAIVDERACEVPLSVLRDTPYSLLYNDVVVATVRSRNSNGWSGDSTPNFEGARILTEPVQMAAPFRGTSTTESQIHVKWVALEGDEIRGSTISSYHLQWDKGTDGVTWFDLSGLTSQNLDLEFIVHNSDVVGGQVY